MSEDFAYSKSWDEIEDMLRRAERKQHRHLMALQDTKLNKQQKLHHMKQYKGLEALLMVCDGYSAIGIWMYKRCWDNEL